MATKQTDGSHAEDTPMLDLFGDTARARILSVLVGFRNRELNVSELGRQAGVTRDSVYAHIDDLERAGAVEKREVANGARYTLADNRVGTLLRDLDFAVLDEVTDHENIE